MIVFYVWVALTVLIFLFCDVVMILLMAADVNLFKWWVGAMSFYFTASIMYLLYLILTNI